jgi:hypothetical protein
MLRVLEITVVSLSGRDGYDALDTSQLYQEHDYRALPQPLQIPPDGYAHDEFAYASHGSGTSLSGKLVALFVSLRIVVSNISTICSLYSFSTCLLLQSLLVVAMPCRCIVGCPCRQSSVRLRASEASYAVPLARDSRCSMSLPTSARVRL